MGLANISNQSINGTAMRSVAAQRTGSEIKRGGGIRKRVLSTPSEKVGGFN